MFFLTCRNLLGSIPDKEEFFQETKNLYERLSNFIEHSIFLLRGVPSKLLPNAEKSRKEALKLLKEFNIPNRKNVSDVIMGAFNVEPSESKHHIVTLNIKIIVYCWYQIAEQN